MVARESNMQKKIFFLGKWMDLSVATPRSTLVWLSCYSGAHGLDFIFGGISAVTRYATCSPISLPPTGPGPFVCSFCIVFVFDRLNRMCKNSRRSWSNTANAKKHVKSMTCTLQSKTSVTNTNTNTNIFPVSPMVSRPRNSCKDINALLTPGERTARRQSGFPRAHVIDGAAQVSRYAKLHVRPFYFFFLLLTTCIFFIIFTQLFLRFPISGDARKACV